MKPKNFFEDPKGVLQEIQRQRQLQQEQQFRQQQQFPEQPHFMPQQRHRLSTFTASPSKMQTTPTFTSTTISSTPSNPAILSTILPMNSQLQQQPAAAGNTCRPKPGILRLDMTKPRRSSGGSVEFRNQQPQMHGAAKCKRVRKNPTKKLSFEEEKALIEYLMSNRDIEKPTAQSYYRKFSTDTKVGADWKLVRAKVRNMKTNYNKAKSWEGSTGAGSMNGETLKATLNKMCKFFYELEDIFGTRLVENSIIEESLDSIIEIDCTEQNIDESPQSSTTYIENLASSSRKGVYSRTALSNIEIEIHTDMLEFRKEKAEKEFSSKEKEYALKKKEIELREKEIESNEKLKIMELQMRERLAMEELKLKYK